MKSASKRHDSGGQRLSPGDANTAGTVRASRSGNTCPGRLLAEYGDALEAEREARSRIPKRSHFL